MKAACRRLDEVYRQARSVKFKPEEKFVFMSDCHRGVGNWGDNFQGNQNLFFSALQYYDQRNFTYVELGDGDELWENRNLKDIVQVHSNQFWMMSKFYKKGKLYMLFGNHDRKKECQKYFMEHCENYYSESEDGFRSLFPGLEVQEGLILENAVDGSRIFLVHGHQGDFINDTAWKLGRFLVRYVWRKLELTGFLDPTSAAKNYKKKKRVEKRLSTWADENKVLLMAGHTHRPMLPLPGEGRYLNDGSCVHPRCITAMELEHGMLRLVKWSIMVREDRLIYVGREVLSGPYALKDYYV